MKKSYRKYFDIWISKFKKIGNNRKALIEILIIYTLFILCMTLLFREETNGEHLQLELFWSYKVIGEEWLQMLGNVLLFIPLGLLLKSLGINTWLILLIGFTFSCSIELLQYVFKLGLCELDDVFHNTLGTLIGLFIGNWIRKQCLRRLEIDGDKNTGL